MVSGETKSHCSEKGEAEGGACFSFPIMKNRALVLATFLLVGAVVGWKVFRGSTAAGPKLGDRTATDLVAEVNQVSLEASGDHAHLVLTITFQQNGRTAVRLEPPLVRLRTGDGESVPRYLGPLLPEPVLTGAGPTPVALHYWMPLAKGKQGLMLEVGGKRHAVALR